MENCRLIAYNNLKRNILDNGFCTGCGACEATCPVNALQVEDTQVKRLYDCSKSIDLCPICNEVCPHSQALLLRSLEAVSDAPSRSEAVGYFRKIVLAQASDPKIRQESADGAVVTSLLTYGVENKIVDSAVVTQTDPETPIEPKPSVALTPQEVISATGSKFFPSNVIKAYGSAVLEYAKQNIAVVGLPCQLLALRKVDAWQHKISGKSKITLGLFCFGTFPLKPFLDYVEKEYKIPVSDVYRMHVAHDLTVYTEQGAIEIPLSDAKQLINLGCKTCIDYTSEVADISVGNAYPLKEWSIVIIRTKAGEDFFNSALQKGVIKTQSIDDAPEVFEHLIMAALQKRTAGLIKAAKLEETQEYVPVRLLRETDSLADVKVETIMSRNVVTVPSSMTVNDLLAVIVAKTFIGYPVVDEKNELVGVVTVEEATKVDKAARSKTLVAAIARPNLDVCYPGETALDVVRKMRKLETGRVLVLDPQNPQKILGIITKRDIMHTLVKEASESVLGG